MSRNQDDCRKRSTTRIAVVTGASKGIGRIIALELAQHGMKVIVGYHTNKSGAVETCRLITLKGGEAEIFAADLRNEQQVEQLMCSPSDFFGDKADVLINNAAISKSGPLNSLSASDWSDVLAVDLVGVGLCIRYFASQCVNQQGDVINIASTAGFAPLPRSPHYAAAKGGLIAMTRELALELAPTIRVNAIAPGFVDSIDSSEGRGRRFLLDQIPLGRLVHPGEIARIARFMLTDDLSITGHTIVIDGGWSLNHVGGSPS